MNKFSYYIIIIHFIPNNTDYNSCRNFHSVYQTYLYSFIYNCLWTFMSSYLKYTKPKKIPFTFYGI